MPHAVHIKSFFVVRLNRSYLLFALIKHSWLCNNYIYIFFFSLNNDKFLLCLFLIIFVSNIILLIKISFYIYFVYGKINLLHKFDERRLQI